MYKVLKKCRSVQIECYVPVELVNKNLYRFNKLQILRYKKANVINL